MRHIRAFSNWSCFTTDRQTKKQKKKRYRKKRKQKPQNDENNFEMNATFSNKKKHASMTVIAVDGDSVI